MSIRLKSAGRRKVEGELVFHTPLVAARPSPYTAWVDDMRPGSVPVYAGDDVCDLPLFHLPAGTSDEAIITAMHAYKIGKQEGTELGRSHLAHDFKRLLGL